ncbi:MAG: hypothetical protein FWE35_07960 [Streptosporangiales bacterium]|jgi:hypothetical protein|nr:hypothetical protein [Streptosporangiales bacterium]
MAAQRDELEGYGRVGLERLLLAVDVLLRLAEDSDAVTGALESDLWPLRNRIERALLLPADNLSP